MKQKKNFIEKIKVLLQLGKNELIISKEYKEKIV